MDDRARRGRPHGQRVDRFPGRLHRDDAGAVRGRLRRSGGAGAADRPGGRHRVVVVVRRLPRGSAAARGARCPVGADADAGR
ncbi:MAG: hypothetical protein AVDCRST_MAG16-3018 [uncultured Frankineae bacterium]|uniref:Uncharacterized protein n=1 Tax=uncultured Frankineae bacterium TaxID=437475 RepID=A0A6J4MIN2_9ACTN|nr:MAG: hypothetical protein AVDCRST_MAG16-3018 [uncultured Frankineae bacterium]